MRLAVAVKLDCLVAIATALISCCASAVEGVWYSARSYLFHSGDTDKADKAWDDFHTAVDVMLSGVTGLFDSDAVLTAADRGNIRKICDLGRKIQDVQANPAMNPDTKKELETWYRNTKVFVRTGGDEATKEMQGLYRALEQVRATPETAPEKLKAWRWDTRMADSAAAEKIRGISWAVPEPAAVAEDITKRAWKKKSS